MFPIFLGLFLILSFSYVIVKAYLKTKNKIYFLVLLIVTLLIGSYLTIVINNQL